MDENKFNLAFGDTVTGRLNAAVKPIPAKFKTTEVRWGLEVSEGDRPAEPFMPNRYAPIVREIRNVSLFEKGIVIPTGTILSAIPLFNLEYYRAGSPTIYGGLGASSGSVSSGNIALGLGYGDVLLQGPIDDMIEGYDRLRLVGTIANGGASATDPYTQYDVDRGRVGIDGTLVTTSSTFTRAANIPIGFTTEDIYLFDDGGKLNYTEIKWNKFSSFATDYFIEMPYCAGTTVTDGSTYGGSGGVLSAKYTAVKALGIPFYWAYDAADMIIGSLVQSDLNGKWRAQTAAGSALTASKTAQTVGKLISYTNKFPGDLEQFVETWSSSNVGGTATYGIPQMLWLFVTAILGTTDYATVKAAMNSGAYGIARINVHVS